MAVGTEVVKMVVVTFARTNVKVKFCTPIGVMKVVLQVVTITSIGLIAGTFIGTRTASAASIVQAITRILIVSCLFKSILSRCWV